MFGTTVSPSRKYLAMCVELQANGYIFHVTELPKNTPNNSYEAEKRYIQELSATQGLVGCVAVEATDTTVRLRAMKQIPIDVRIVRADFRFIPGLNYCAFWAETLPPTKSGVHTVEGLINRMQASDIIGGHNEYSNKVFDLILSAYVSM